jgi:hypothetical protein
MAPTLRFVGALALLIAATSTASLPLAVACLASGLGLGATLPAD